ncbi:hypothetical protein FRB90_002375 [Tulasnella sp. 427]|nr:hypothetical protein FRB90_002375 [Tulasnella sp. 427]
MSSAIAAKAVDAHSGLSYICFENSGKIAPNVGWQVSLPQLGFSKDRARRDGDSPCANCQKAHAHAIKVDSASAPSEPTCTYDDADLKMIGPKARIATLEFENGPGDDTDHPSPSGIGSTIAAPTTTSVLQPTQAVSTFTTNSLFTPHSDPMSIGSILVPTSPWDMAGIEFTPITPPMPTDGTPPSTFELTADIWPLNIPPPETLYHLVETFFASVPLASRLIHKPTFIASLQLIPTSSKFPHVALLHAICGIASLYSPIIREYSSQSPEDSDTARPFNSGIVIRPNAEEGVQGKCYYPRSLKDVMGPGPDGFGSMHIRWAGETMRLATRSGDRLLQLLQAAIIVTWYHFSKGLVIGVYAWLGSVAKFVAPLGLNVSNGFEPLSRLPSSGLFLLGKPKSTTEAETIRNIFWITYVMERLYTAGTVWSLAMNDEDISQMMPCRFSDLVSGTFVPTQGRQHLFSNNMLLLHPPLTTDSWTLYIKATVLVSRVRTFNRRYRLTSRQRTANIEANPTESDVFVLLDQMITAFPPSLPAAFRTSVGEKVDPLLYMAHLLPHVAMIQLHDPHADFGDPTDPSTVKLALAVQSILDLIYAICATSFDLIYLDHAASFCWFVAGAAISRFLKAKIILQDETEVERLTQDLNTVKFVLSNLGDRTMIGLRQIKLLNELYEDEINTNPDRADCICKPRRAWDAEYDAAILNDTV